MANVLIIDDDEDHASAIALMLRESGHEADIQLEIKGATQRVKERRPDLIILDVMFPEDPRGGFKLAWKIRSLDEDVKMPILMLTSVTHETDAKVSAKDIDDVWLPVTDFVEKPVDLKVLLEKVTSLLQAGSEANGDQQQ